MNVYDCWIVAYRDGKRTELNLNLNAHEALFAANTKTGGTITGIVALFQNHTICNQHRFRGAKQPHKIEHKALEFPPQPKVCKCGWSYDKNEVDASRILREAKGRLRPIWEHPNFHYVTLPGYYNPVEVPPCIHRDLHILDSAISHVRQHVPDQETRRRLEKEHEQQCPKWRDTMEAWRKTKEEILLSWSGRKSR